MIQANVFNNELRIENNTISDSVKFDTIKFSFPETWDNYTKTAVFTCGDATPISIVLNGESELCIAEDECYIPYEVLKVPGFGVSVFGIRGDSVATTTKAKVLVLQSGYTEGEAPSEPTPTEYQQIINITNDTKRIAESVRQDANNGLFKGEKGEKGEQGEKGEKGEKGDQGEPGNIENVDSIYDASSKNAQSGTAVAGALVNYVSLEDNMEWIFDGGDSANSVDADFVIDDEVSDVSDNAVANKVIKGYVDGKIAETTEFVNSEFDEKTEYFDSKFTETTEYVDSRTIDYIIEQGADDNWTYRKWNSGVAECWYKGNVTFPTDGGGAGIEGFFVNSVNITLPFSFIDNPFSVCDTGWNAINWVQCSANKTSVTVRKFANTNGTNATMNDVSIYVKGRWK